MYESLNVQKSFYTLKWLLLWYVNFIPAKLFLRGEKILKTYTPARSPLPCGPGAGMPCGAVGGELGIPGLREAAPAPLPARQAGQTCCGSCGEWGSGASRRPSPGEDLAQLAEEVAWAGGEDDLGANR